ncbi:hypothetical protein [Sphingomonas koreensis]
MMRRIALAAALGAAAFITSSSWACSMAPAEPLLPGESPDAYQARVAEKHRHEAEKWARERQTDALRRADRIFIGRDTDWTPPYRSPPMRRARPGQPPPLVPVPVPPVLIEFPAPSYYKPVDWFRGARSTALFRVRGSNTSCGPMSVGDTTNSSEGDLYVFFARSGPLSEKTLIDAIALDKIDDPALLAFVARHRGKPAARQ